LPPACVGGVDTKCCDSQPARLDITFRTIVAEQIGREIFEFTVTVPNGELTCAEVKRSAPFNY